MVGRNQKVADNEDDEIEILDARRTRKGVKQTRLKKPTKEPEPEKPKENDAELLAGIDLEGVPEVEREEIRRAILLSREEEKQEQVQANSLFDERRKENRPNQENSVKQNVEENEIVDQQMASDDDETQPPDSQKQDGFSLEDEPDSTTDHAEEPRPTLSRENSIGDMFEEEAMAPVSPCFTLHMSVSPSLEVDNDENLEQTQIKEADSTLRAEDSVFDKDTEEMCDTQEYQSEPNPDDRQSETTENHQKPRSESQTSEKSQASAGFEVTDDSKGDSSQGSARSQTSEHSATAAEEQPLKRHYKNVRKQVQETGRRFENVHPVKYFATEGMDPVQCTKVIMQLFDIYAKNLKVAQSKCKDRMPWGEPVKSGQHQSKTIDVKKRGQGSQYMILADSDDETTKAIDKQGASATNDRQKQEMDDDLPNLENRCRRSLRRGDTVNKEMLTAETQAYDPYDFDDLNTNQNVEDADDKDFVPNVAYRMRKPAPKPENTEASKNSVNDNGEINRKAETKSTRGRGRRRNKEARILVEDTQKNVFELSSDEETNDKRNEIPVVVGETQDLDDDENIRSNQQRIPGNAQRNMGQGIGSHFMNNTAETMSSNLTTSEIVKTLHKENFYGKGVNAKIQSEAKVKADQGTNKRRGRPKKHVTLVEDTQDLDEEISVKVNQINPKNTRPVRGKRKSFQLRSDSEEESIPETQELDLSPNITVIENKSVKETEYVQKDNGNTESIASKIGKVGSAMFKTVKHYLSPRLGLDEEQSEDNDHDNINDENSQSPVIKRRKKLYTASEARDLLGTQQTKDGTHDASQQVPTVGRLRRGIITIESETDGRSEGSIVQGGAGVKKLFSRPPSKESNASDDISITTSQGSSTLLDDHGDLFSTQINEKPESFRGRKAQRQVATANSKQNNFDNIKEGNNEEVLVVKAVKKDYRRKPNPRKLGGVNVVKSGNISKFFPKVPQNDNEIVSVDSDSDDSEVAHIGTKQTATKSKNQNSAFVKNENENPIPGNCKAGTQKYTVNVPQVQMPNIISEGESSNDSIQNVLPVGKTLTLKAGNETSPVIPSQFMDQTDAQVHSTVGYGGARSKVVRTRKVSETITSGQLEKNADYHSVDEQRARMRNKRARGNTEETAGQEQPVRKKVHPVGRVSPVLMFPCPLCNQNFPADMIEIHASECVGDVEEEEEEEHEAAVAHAILTRQLRRRPLVHGDHATPHSSRLAHHHDMSDMVHPHVKHAIIQQDLDDLELEEEEEQQELQEIMEHVASQNPVRIEDSHVSAVAKDIKISPGEPGEIECCYICDEMLPKGVVLEQHIQHCLLEAKQQQMEVDKEGFNKVFSRVNQAGDPDTPRTTRRQFRNQGNNNVNLVTINVDAAGHVQREEGYSSGSEGSESIIYGSSWSEESESDSSVDENITLASVARQTGPAALITGPWNEKRNQSKITNKTVTQPENGTSVPDWLNNPSNSPIRSFVPINEQEDREYFERQFQFNKDRVERQMKKRKSSMGKRKGRRRKRRKISRKRTNSKRTKS